jgi:hypothetical protein
MFDKGKKIDCTKRADNDNLYDDVLPIDRQDYRVPA